MSKLKLGGHRGLGCTDHDFYQTRRDISNLPVENTLESIKTAFDHGADYIETDAVMSADGVIFTLHNVVPKDHFFASTIPPKLLNTMDFAEIQKYNIGRENTGKIARLSDVLNLIAQIDPKTLPWAINIEIKGVQGSGQDYEDKAYIANLAKTVEESNLPADRILWSSFSMENIIRMSYKFPESKFGMLFSEKEQPRAIYANHQHDFRFQYLPFEMNYMDMIQDEWLLSACPDAVLEYAHPEIMTVTPEKIAALAGDGFGLNVWALFEEFNETRQEVYKNLASHAANSGVPFTVITDYLAEMQKLEF